MSLYDGIDLEDKQAVSAKANIAGWSSSLKLLETQKQLQEKKLMLQNMTKKKNVTSLAPVVNLRSKKSEETTSQFDQHVGKIEGSGSSGLIGSQFLVGGGEVGFVGVVDEYDPMRPNDYEKIVKSKKPTKEYDDDYENERKSRREERRHSRSDDRHHGDSDHDRSRPSGWRSFDSPVFENRKRGKYEDEEDHGGRRKRRNEDERHEEPVVQKAAIAPPLSLLEDKKPEDFMTGPTLNKPEPVGTKFGMGGSVASKIMARMGYKEGQGLGKQEQGMSIALQVEKTSKKIGKIIHEKDLHKSQDMSVPRAETSNANLLRNPSKVIVLRNMVGPGDVDDMLEAEVSEECGKYGKVVKCVIFEIPETCEEEAVRIFVEFDRLEASIKAVVDLNGRFFAGRVVKGNFYDVDKFKNLTLGDDID